MRLLGAVVDWSLHNRAVVLIATLVLVIIGTVSARRIPVDVVPDITDVQVQVITTSPALSPVEVEQYVSIPVERAMAGIPHVTQIRSLSKYGISVVTIVFDEGTDVYFARQLVNERMVMAADAVPPRYGTPEIGPMTTGLGEIFQFTVRNDALTLMELEELLDWYIAPRLRTVPGVVEVNSMGGENREYQVVIDPTRLQAMSLSIRDVVTAIQQSNANAGGGYIERHREHFVIGTNGLVTGRQDLERVVLGATPQGAPITVANVGEVRFGPRLRRGASSFDGKGESVVGVVLMLTGANPRAVTEAVKARIEAIAPGLPPGTSIDPFYDRSRLVDRTIRTAVTNLVEGAVLVIVILLLLLGDLRAGLVVASVIPLSMLFAVTMMAAGEISGNLMSLGAIDFGLIVDGAVIVIENAKRRIDDARQRAGRPLAAGERLSIVRDATMEVRSATVFGELVIAVVYVPIILLTGVEGKLFRPMATTVLLALSGAFILSLTWVPVLASFVLRGSPDEHRETRVVRLAARVYRPLLERTLRWRKATAAVGAAAIFVAALLFMRLGAEFVPQLDEGDILLEVNRLPGVALTEAVHQDARMQRALSSIPEVRGIVSKTGSPEVANDAMGIEQSDVFIELVAAEDWRPGLTKPMLAREIAHAVEAAVPEVVVAISQPIQMRTNELVAGVRSDVGVLLYGPDHDVLLEVGDQIRHVLEKVRGVEDLRREQISGLRYLRIVPDRGKLARWGLTVADVNLAVETIAVGHDAGVVLEGDRRFTIRIKTAQAPNEDVENIATIPLRSPSGAVVPLGDVVDLRWIEGPNVINRESQSRRLVIEFNVRDRDLVSAVTDAQRAVAEQVDIPIGYHVEWGGTFEHYIEAKRRLSLVVPAALGLILFLLWLAFHNMQPALLIFATVPFACVGGVLALLVRGIPFSISAGIGFIALSGVAVLNGIVLVMVAWRLEHQGVSPIEAIRSAARQRLRPVLTTALVASFGFVPMALSNAPGSEVQRPLATVVIGGLISATIMTLLVLPALYAMIRRTRSRPFTPSRSDEATSE